jgi:ppGpp synthetase/RelA/SpoT-type nucleotidyltranferase
MILAADYTERFEKVLRPLSTALEDHLRDLLEGVERIDRIQARPKSIARFLDKAAKTDEGKAKYSEPLHQIQDQIGARIICFYLDDVDRISGHLEKYMKSVEARFVVPESDAEFGYFGKHYVLFIPRDLMDNSWDKALIPEFFELQIKTLFQHAWSEADHDLGYKPGSVELSKDQKRKIAFTSAQAWGADQLFNELFIERDIEQVRRTL